MYKLHQPCANKLGPFVNMHNLGLQPTHTQNRESTHIWSQPTLHHHQQLDIEKFLITTTDSSLKIKSRKEKETCNIISFEELTKTNVQKNNFNSLSAPVYCMRCPCFNKQASFSPAFFQATQHKQISRHLLLIAHLPL